MDAAVWNEIKALFATAEPAALGPETRAGVMPAVKLDHRLDELLSRAGLAETNAQLVRSTLLLWHDHLDESHTISQSIETPDGSFLHGIMHRREPDYWNSKYWFRRLGNHPAFSEIGKNVSALLSDPKHPALKQQLLPRGTWDAFAFVDACEAAAGRSGTESDRAVLRELQRVELEALLARFCGVTAR